MGDYIGSIIIMVTKRNTRSGYAFNATWRFSGRIKSTFTEIPIISHIVTYASASSACLLNSPTLQARGSEI